MIREKEEIVKTSCCLCGLGCGVLVHIVDGTPVKIEGDPTHPVNSGALCVIGNASLEYLNNPDRLKYPMKREGERGAGKFHRISWDEALETIASKFNGIKETNGPESVAFMQGYAKGSSDAYLARFANVFGSPNMASMSYICFHSKLRGSLATCGYLPTPDFDYPPECIVLWAANPSGTNFPQGLKIREAMKRGSKLIVIDPGETFFAKKAELWVKPRPSSDLALALGMINIIINEELHNVDFVKEWTVGFHRLKSHIQDYPPDKVAEITWVPAETVEELARQYACNRPGCIISGNGTENNINNYQFSRAISILRAITGNIGVPGGEIDLAFPNLVPGGSLEMHRYDLISPELRARRIGAEEGALPDYFSALPQKLVKAMLTSDPYPILAAFIYGGNILHTQSNTLEIYNALKNLDFLVVSDHFMTPTAEMADLVLPVGTYLEIDDINVSETPFVSAVQKVAQVGENWSACRIFNELGRKMKLENHFWENDEKALDFILKPAGLTFEEFRKVGVLYGNKIYRGYETDGFQTVSKKVELYSGQLEEWGFDPLPVYHEPPESPFSDVDLSREYPLVLTNWKVSPFIHSSGRQIKSLREKHPEPLVIINTKTANKLGIQENNWVYIENKRGRIRQKAKLSSNIDDRVVLTEHGWWYPEKNGDMHGWKESNMNILTDNNPPYSRELGSVTFRGILCKVYKAD